MVCSTSQNLPSDVTALQEQLIRLIEYPDIRHDESVAIEAIKSIVAQAYLIGKRDGITTASIQ